MTYYRIVGPFCGRDKDGNFHCACGKCRELAEREAKHGDIVWPYSTTILTWLSEPEG